MRFFILAVFACVVASASAETFNTFILSTTGSFTPEQARVHYANFWIARSKAVTGSDATFKNHEAEVNAVCFSDSVNLYDLFATLRHFNPFATFPKICGLKKYIPCIETATKYFTTLLDDEEKIISEVLALVAKPLTDFGCASSVNDLESIFDLPVDECLDRKRDLATKQCFKNAVKPFASSLEAWRFIESVLTTQKCSDLVNFETCFLGQFNECENKKPVEFMNNLLKVIIGVTPCHA